MLTRVCVANNHATGWHALRDQQGGHRVGLSTMVYIDESFVLRIVMQLEGKPHRDQCEGHHVRLPRADDICIVLVICVFWLHPAIIY